MHVSDNFPKISKDFRCLPRDYLERSEDVSAVYKKNSVHISHLDVIDNKHLFNRKIIQSSSTHLNKFIRKLNPVLMLFSGIKSNQKTGCSGSEILNIKQYIHLMNTTEENTNEKILKNKQHYTKVLLSSFYLKGHTF